MAVDDLLARIKNLRDAADGERREERRAALSSSIAHYVFGFAGIMGGAVAAATASAQPGWIPVVGGVVAAISSGVLTAFKFEEKARRRYRKERRYRSVIERACNTYARLDGTADIQAAAQALEDLQNLLEQVRSET